MKRLPWQLFYDARLMLAYCRFIHSNRVGGILRRSLDKCDFNRKSLFLPWPPYLKQLYFSMFMWITAFSMMVEVFSVVQVAFPTPRKLGVALGP